MTMIDEDELHHYTGCDSRKSKKGERFAWNKWWPWIADDKFWFFILKMKTSEIRMTFCISTILLFMLHWLLVDVRRGRFTNWENKGFPWFFTSSLATAIAATTPQEFQVNWFFFAEHIFIFKGRSLVLNITNIKGF